MAVMASHMEDMDTLGHAYQHAGSHHHQAGTYDTDVSDEPTNSAPAVGGQTACPQVRVLPAGHVDDLLLHMLAVGLAWGRVGARGKCVPICGGL